MKGRGLFDRLTLPRPAATGLAPAKTPSASCVTAAGCPLSRPSGPARTGRGKPTDGRGLCPARRADSMDAARAGASPHALSHALERRLAARVLSRAHKAMNASHANDVNVCLLLCAMLTRDIHARPASRTA